MAVACPEIISIFTARKGRKEGTLAVSVRFIRKGSSPRSLPSKPLLICHCPELCDNVASWMQDRLKNESFLSHIIKGQADWGYVLG